jgi:kynurenine 3-monooxygenase
MATDNNKAVVAGAGPVGALAAIALARQGWDVEVKDLHCRVRLFDSL